MAQMCGVHLQYGNSTIKWPFYTFFRVISTLHLSILFGWVGGLNLVLNQIKKLGQGDLTFELETFKSTELT